MSRRGALSPVGRETLHDRVYAELRRSLIHGMFDAGDMLRIQDLAETLQTSTMPVREALGAAGLGAGAGSRCRAVRCACRSSRASGSTTLPAPAA